MRNALLAVLLFAALAGNIFAQTGNASLGGSVQDPSNALIPGVTITAKNVDTAVTLMQITPSTTGQAAHASYPPDAAPFARSAIGARMARPVVVTPTLRVVITTLWACSRSR